MGFKAGAFLDGINNGLSLAQRFSTMRDQRDMREIANAKPEEGTGYTAADGEQLQGLASAKDQSGKPYYNVSADESGSYTVTPNQEAQGFGLSDYKGSTEPVKIDQHKVTDFLGERTAGGLSDAQIKTQRTAKMADVISRTDPERGLRMQREATNSAREDERYSRDQQKWQREDKAATEEDAFKQSYRKVYDSTIYAQRMSEYAPKAEAYTQQMAERKAALEAGMSPEKLGPALQEPVRPGYTIAESLSDQAAILDFRIKAGKADPNEVAKYAETIKKTHEEGYIKALQLAQSGAPIESIANAFNQSGEVKFDPRAIVGDEMGKTPEGAATRIIKIKDPQTGEVQTINTLSELDGMGKATSYFDRFFKAKETTAKGRAPSGYQWAPNGSLEPIPGGPATKKTAESAPSGYRFKQDGSLEAIPGGPGDKKQTLKALPTSAAGGLISNVQNLRRAEDALALLSGQKLEGGAVGDTEATGLKNMLPNQVLNRIDPKGVDTRAAVADLGSLVIHDRSGAAVTASEFPRLAPFIPTATDDPATAKKKLAQFVQNYRATVEDTAEFYRASGYNVPTETLRTSNASKPGGASASAMKIPRVATTADAAKLPSGTVFIDPNGVKRKVP